MSRSMMPPDRYVLTWVSTAPGGAERSVAELATALCAQGHQVHVVLWDQAGRTLSPALSLPFQLSLVTDFTSYREALEQALAPGAMALISTHRTASVDIAAARRHEAAALFGRDLVLVAEGMLVNVEVSKTHPRQVAVPYSSDPALCPVRTWLEWKEAAGIEPDTPALRRMHRTGSVTRAGLSPQSVGTVITEAAQRAGLNVRFTGHSARRGFITESAKAGKDRKAIGQVSGHVDGSRALEGYIELANRFGDQENAIQGIM